MPMDETSMTEALGMIRDAGDVANLRAAVMRALGLCGIEAAYFVAPLTRDSRAERSMTNIGLPPEWEQRYREERYRVDPLPSLSLRHSNAFCWPGDVDTGELTKPQSSYLEYAAQFGLARGIGVACYGPQGRAGFLGAVWSQIEPPTDAAQLAVHQIGQIGFQRYCHIVSDNSALPPLSNRELEVLAWMCRGKTNPEMATIIGVSRSSIDAYIRRIFAKLEVTDRTAACVRAFSLGFVVSDEVEKLTRQARERDEPGT